MKILGVMVLWIATCCSATAQTEDDLLKYVESHKPMVDAGTLSNLDYHKEIHRRISIIPGAAYKWKLANLKMIGERIDILEAVEAGKISPDKAKRMFAEQEAQTESDDQRRGQAEVDSRNRAFAERQHREQQMAAQEEQQRRAIALQLLQNMQNRPTFTPTPFTPIPVPRRTVCNTTNIGGQLQTVCQ